MDMALDIADSLAELITALQAATSVLHKQDIQVVASSIGQVVQGVNGAKIRLGDDCAAIPAGQSQDDGYLLFAAEGIWPQLVADEPWFAGWCAVMVNLSDVAAMGGEAIAIVDALWSQSVESSEPIWAGMQAASKAYGVPIVGGHTNCHSDYDGLAVSVMGRATSLITSFDAQPADALVMVVNMQGAYYKGYSFWNAATTAKPCELREHLAVLSELAEAKLCSAGKDISMGGLVGTLLMLCEASDCGAQLNLNTVPKPNGVDWQKWLTSFPSYGFLLTAPAEKVAKIQALFSLYGLTCQQIGEITTGTEVSVQLGDEQQVFWDLKQPLTGFGGKR